MNADFLLELARLPLFPRSAAELLRVVGAAATAALVEAWPGQEFPVPRLVGGGNPNGTRRWEQLVEVVGVNAAERIVGHWGGTPLTIPNLFEVRRSYTQDLIRADFDTLTVREGYSFTEAVFTLGIKYRITGKAVEKILKRPSHERADLPTQGSLF